MKFKAGDRIRITWKGDAHYTGQLGTVVDHNEWVHVKLDFQGGKETGWFSTNVELVNKPSKNKLLQGTQ